MMGSLSGLFVSIAYKRLTAHEVDPKTSHGHEFQGVAGLREVFGAGRRKEILDAVFVYLADDSDESEIHHSAVTWYDARQNQPHRSPEFRLFYSTPTVQKLARPGDLFVLGRRPDNTVLIVIAPRGSSSERQVLWLFGINDAELGQTFAAKKLKDDEGGRIDLIKAQILESIGMEVPAAGGADLDELHRRFGDAFPTCAEFSQYARDNAPVADSKADPDMALMIWMDHEEALFRQFERHIVEKRLKKGFGTDVDQFISYSLSVHNRRKARVGRALENHAEQIFHDWNIRCVHGKTTEGQSRPDFLFPGIEEYRDNSFPATRLSMLGVKSTCKDRWRQVLAEAARIRGKHLLTLEAGISTNQTDEMRRANLQLVCPGKLHGSFTPGQRRWLMNVRSFLEMVQRRQRG